MAPHGLYVTYVIGNYGKLQKCCLICIHMYGNRRITQSVNCHYDLFSRIVRIQQATIEHCLHSVNVGTVHRRKYVKGV